MDYSETLEYINSLKRGKPGGLERTRRLLAALRNPQDAYPTVHVGGTNGKGSVCAFMRSILSKAGYTAGLMISPYLQRFEERMQIDAPIPGDELARAATEVRAAAERLNIEPGGFDFIVATGFLWFEKRRVDCAVVEVGLGGRFDQTNVIVPRVSVITPVALDHTRILGNTAEKIAAEKCGIIKPGVPVVSGLQEAGVLDVIAEACARNGSELNAVSGSDVGGIEFDGEYQSFLFRGKRFRTRLLGEHQAYNAATAVLAAQALCKSGFAVDDAAIYAGLETAVWLGRFERLRYKGVPVVLDGAHNPHGAEALARAAAKYAPGRKVLLCAIMADKDTAAMARTFAGFADEVVTVSFGGRSLDAGALSELFPQELRAGTYYDVAEALEAAAEKARGGTLVVAGSLYLVGMVRNLVVGK